MSFGHFLRFPSFSGQGLHVMFSRKSSIADHEAISRLGELMEQYPGAILDSAMLPLPKPKMKALIKAAWIESDDRFRDGLELAYVYLSNFQDGVGPKPVLAPADGPNSKDPKRIKTWIHSDAGQKIYD
jgi:hypothetical protein